MAGNRNGGLKIRATMIKKLGSEEAYIEWRKSMGRKGGHKSKGGGFASDKIGKDGLTGYERAVEAGKVGGKVPRIKSIDPKDYDEIRRKSMGM